MIEPIPPFIVLIPEALCAKINEIICTINEQKEEFQCLKKRMIILENHMLDNMNKKKSINLFS